MKNRWKILYLIFILFAITSIFMIITGFEDEIPRRFDDTQDMEISDVYRYSVNNMEYSDGTWSIVGSDPYIVFSGVNKYINGVDVYLENNGDHVGLALYYNTGKGFNQSEIIGFEDCGEGHYHSNLNGNMTDLRLDIENISDSDKITDIRVNLHNGLARWKNNLIKFIIIISIMLILSVVLIIYEVIVKKTNLKTCAVKVIILAIFIGESARSLLKITIKYDIILMLIFGFIGLTCFFYNGDFVSEKTDNLEVEEVIDEQ